MSRARRVLTGLVLLAGLVPVALAGVQVARHAQNVPFWDEWHEPLDIALKTVEGRLTVGDLVRQHNDSRPVSLNLLTALSARLTGWSLKLQMAASLALAGATLLLLTSLYRGAEPRAWLVVWIPFSALVFSLLQRRTWLWAIQIQYVFLVLFVVGALWTVGRFAVGWRPLVGAAVLTVGATLSFANGFLMWAVMVPVLWMLGYRRWTHALFWAGVTVAALATYFTDYELRVPSGARFDPVFLLQFVVVYLGNAFTVREVVAHLPGEIVLNAMLGAVGLLAFATNVALLWWIRRSGRDVAPWVGMALLVVISAVVAGMGRRQMGGIEAAMHSRYVTLATLFWVAFVAVALMAMARLGATRPWVRDVNVVIMASLLLVFVLGSWRFRGSRPTITEAERACFLAYPTSRDATCLSHTSPVLRDGHPDRQALLDKLDLLARYKLAAFGELPRR